MITVRKREPGSSRYLRASEQEQSQKVEDLKDVLDGVVLAINEAHYGEARRGVEIAWAIVDRFYEKHPEK